MATIEEKRLLAKRMLAKQQLASNQAQPQSTAHQATAVPQESSPLEYASGIMQEAGQGATFGLSDEALAGAFALYGTIAPESMGGLPDGVTIGDAYKGIRGNLNQDRAEFKEENPNAALAAEVAGGLATGGMGLVKSAKVLAPAGSGVARRMAAGGLIGGTEAAIYGAGSAEEGERLEGAIEAAPLGVIGGAVLPEVIRGGGKIAQRFKDKIETNNEIARILTEGINDNTAVGYMLKTDNLIDDIPSASTGGGNLLPKPAAKTVVGSSASKIKTKANEAREALGLGSNRFQPDPLEKEALKQGWDSGVLSTVKTMSPGDRKTAREMINIAEIGKRQPEFKVKHLHTDPLGDTIADMARYIGKENRAAGSAVGKASRSLKDTPIDLMEETNGFIDKLDEMGIKVGGLENQDGYWLRTTSDPLKVNFTDSRIEFNPASKGPIKDIVEKLSRPSGIDAYDAHELKKIIDDMISYGKTKTGLAGEGEKVIRDFRTAINAKLRVASPEYGAANQKYSDTIKAIEAMDKATGSKVDIMNNSSIGGELRALTSKRQSRHALSEAIGVMDDVSSKYGYTTDKNVYKQLIFADELEDLFKTAPKNSLRGQTAGAAADVAGGQNLKAARDAGAAVLESAQGINEDNKIKVIKQLLGRQQ